MRRLAIRTLPTAALVTTLLATGAPDVAQPQAFTPPDDVVMKEIVIWSDGYRLDGDIFYPKSMAPDAKLPAIVLSHGWGGTKTSSRRTAARFAQDGYIALGLSFRTWGKSEGPMILLDGMPEKLDESNEATVRVRFVREVVDPLAWAADYRAAFDYVEGEPNVDTARIGAWGTSYGGGMAIWAAAHDPRVRAVVSQVGGMGVPWPQMQAVAKQRATDIARGDAEPIPQDLDKTGQLRGTPHFAKMIQYDAVAVAHKVKAPTLLIDAENEELFDRRNHSLRVFETMRAHGTTPVRYEVVPEITHYGIYREAFERSVELALEWFEVHLKNAP
ncbi:MAG TPA: alpha/beta fold hydrolase [Thermoanaerobaculia bacterium]|nr:alpha/beta fold hydrolase [Thermoanaerobaculia bacterium]